MTCITRMVLKEVEMLLHLPIVILTTLSPIHVSDAVPKFDIAKECRFEGGTSATFDRCSHDEAEALQQLQAEWPQFAGSDRAACLAEATVAGFASYVDLIICLEMAKHVSQETNPRGSLGTQSMRLEQPEMSIVDRTK
jgi:hypothetical protein